MTSVVIVNWNGAAYLPRLIASLEPERPDSIVVVDNKSGDDSLDLLRRFPNVRVLANEKNLGYARAANQGIAACESQYILLLNVDVEVRSKAIAMLEQQLNVDPTVAVAAPQLLFPDGNLQRSLRAFPTPGSISLYLSFLDRVFPSTYRLPERDHHQMRFVDQPMGAAMMIRKSAWEQVQGFDERFFLYMEEVDFCYRLKQAGHKILYVPDAKMVHHAGGSSRQSWENSQQHFIDSIFFYFRKHSPGEVSKLRWMLSAALFFRGIVLMFAGRFLQSRFYLRQALAPHSPLSTQS